MKDTFILRTEWWDAISELNSEEQAEIIRLLFLYHLEEPNFNLNNLINLSVKLVWKMIEPNLKRNIDAYDKRCEQSKKNGKLGGRPKTKKNLKKPLSESESESESDSVTVNENKKEKRSVKYADAPASNDPTLASAPDKKFLSSKKKAVEAQPKPDKQPQQNNQTISTQKFLIPCRDIYEQWCEKKLNAPAIINGKEIKSLETICKYLRKLVTLKKKKDSNAPAEIIVSNEEITAALKYTLDNFDKWDAFHQKNIHLSQIASNIQNITNSIINPRQNGKQTYHKNGYLTDEEAAIIGKGTEKFLEGII